MFFVLLSASITCGAIFGILGPARLTKLGKRGRIVAAVILVLMVPVDYSVFWTVRADPTALWRRNCAPTVTKWHPVSHQVCY